MSDTLTIEGVDAFYGPSHVLHGVTLTVMPGEVVLLLDGMAPAKPRSCARSWG